MARPSSGTLHTSEERRSNCLRNVTPATGAGYIYRPGGPKSSAANQQVPAWQCTRQTGVPRATMLISQVIEDRALARPTSDRHQTTPRPVPARLQAGEVDLRHRIALWREAANLRCPPVPDNRCSPAALRRRTSPGTGALSGAFRAKRRGRSGLAINSLPKRNRVGFPGPQQLLRGFTGVRFVGHVGSAKQLS